MTEVEKNLTTRISNLFSEIKTYIELNSDWIYYFLNPLAGGNKELFQLMKENPNNWEDCIWFDILSIESSSITVEINIDDGTEQGIFFRRLIYLPTFSETVNKNKKICILKMKMKK